MSFLKSIGNVFQSTGTFINPISLAKDFSGRSQQDDANAMAMRSWNLANDYNHPIQQMERLKAAGLNPLLVYGSGSVSGNTTSAPSLTGGGVLTGTQSMFSGLSSLMGAVQGYANIQNTRAQTQASTAAAGASTAQASNLNAQAAINNVRAGLEEKSLIADLDYKKAQTRLANQQAKKTSAEADIAQGEADIFGSAGGSKGVKTATDVGRGIARTIRGFIK